MNVVEQVAMALDAGHEAVLIHRDVKPSNILITPRDFVYLIDFGLARTAGQESLTTAGSTLRTMAYMASERFDAGQVDPRSDIYALTCVLYECLTGSRPYPADSLEQQIEGRVVSPLPRPSATDPKLRPSTTSSPTAWPSSRRRAIKRPGIWPPPPGARRLRRYAGPAGSRHSAQRARTPGRPRISWRALAVAGAALLLVAVCAFGAWKWWGGHERRNAVAAPSGAVESIAATSRGRGSTPMPRAG